jgi:hypothetical protein
MQRQSATDAILAIDPNCMLPFAILPPKIRDEWWHIGREMAREGADSSQAGWHLRTPQHDADEWL